MQRELSVGVRQCDGGTEVASELYVQTANHQVVHNVFLTLQRERLHGFAECGDISEFRW